MNVLIVGGGISGISAAKVLLKEGHRVTILESSPDVGGLMARIANCRIGFKTFMDEIKDAEGFNIIKGSKIVHGERKNGLFSVKLDDGRSLEMDRVILATGLSPHDPVEYKGRRILTSLEYDAMIDQKNASLPDDFKRIAFVLCVGSRSKEYPLCSSVCCSYTIREIKWTLQRANPEIKVFYNDLRLFGQEFYMERLFRDKGVEFIRTNTRNFDEDGDGVTIRYFYGGGIKEERVDYAVLTMALRPNPELIGLGEIFGFSLTEYGFVKEKEPLTTDAEGVYACGGTIEPMNIKDSILTGFGAGILASRGREHVSQMLKENKGIYRVEGLKPDLRRDAKSYLFYLGTEEPLNAMLYEYVSERFIETASSLAGAEIKVYVVTKNLVMPSVSEIEYERARRKGVIFIHLEEGESLIIEGAYATISGGSRRLTIPVEEVVLMDDVASKIKDGEFLSFYRSEPQLRWSPTRWDRGRYHAGFIRHPRAIRWEEREVIGALAEMLLDREEVREIPSVDEERCSGCASCKNACPHDAIEIRLDPKDVAIFGPLSSTINPVASINKDLCMGCGLCASTCPSDVIGQGIKKVVE
ncbi:MAG: FAD-dependent oxidoreductase [Syntrophorhabdaceae bacterium]|nr:FAD-dependent oxidoreductase [Syntrophorhabdaceae bacterium]